MFTLEELCINSIVQKFGRFYFAFSVSKDANLQRNFEFLQRRYSAELATELYEVKKLKEEYFEVLINEHLNFLDGEWIKSSKYLNSMKAICLCLPNLTRISFKYCGDEILEYVAKCCPKILEIDARDSNATDNGVKYLCDIKNGMVPCPKIKIILIQNTFVTDTGAESLCRNLPSLEKIGYRNTPLLLHYIHQKHLYESEKIQFYNLVELNLLCVRSTNYSGVLNTCLTVCPKIKELSVSINDEEDFNLFTNTHLKKLHLKCRYSGPKINIDDFLKLNGRNLTYLRLSDCIMSIAVLGAYCPMLKKFCAKRVDFTDDDDLKSNFEVLAECEFSDIDSTFYKAVCLILSFSPNLESVSFESCSQLLHELKSQVLLWCKIPCAKKIELKWICIDDGIEFLRDILLNCPSLETLLLIDFYSEGTDSGWEETEEWEETLQDLAKSLPNKPKIIISEL